MDKERLESIRAQFSNKTIAVVGDLMLDGYFRGIVKRVSPEAPVPVVEVDHEFFRFGGAANVALNIQQLGGNPIPIGVIGEDADGRIFKDLLKESKINSNGI
ncbi:MAG: PfkB family carbohydrate kinase, partial [Melioribacteraceae bacterium]|nr:PfkB family carbohydrate kinase [Melioribacteraceae bacterium]